MIEALTYIIPGVIALIGNYFLSNYRLTKIEDDIKAYKDINERLARIEGKLDYITSK
jgi:hypothetical protein